MNIDSYQKLNVKEESSSEYRNRLRAFAIAYRIRRPSNYFYVADEIISLDLINVFMQFDVAGVRVY